MTNEEIFGIMDDVVNAWGLYIEDINIYTNDLEATIVGQYDSRIYYTYNDIDELEGKSEKEIFASLEKQLIETLEDFDAEEEFENLDLNDTRILENMKLDEKDFKETVWMYEQKQKGKEVSSFELALTHELQKLGQLMNDEVYPGMVASYAVDISRVRWSNEIYEYMKEKNIDMSDADYYDVNFFSIVKRDYLITELWTQGKKDEAVKQFQKHVF
ncbi:hypothetical protein A8C46_00480 [Ligilactobacillus salivarius]|uniref:hypothetical protein n=2 Tax=Ligilactobacillus salivarius TaxID=1624 RepID=UPI000A2E0AC8|nr:hypothetical protein [Ligilactobacillus salivarius]OTF89728.1 hypothetical protein A8C38_00160 [Ligilactobacillus salivarius]PAY43563.1 hypothetical protein A8C39_00340 [Ligilactobacillus salivarius]PAY49377.1 hypothetical protein A8C42_00490 [Ligilactobacillus salivarius]PAY58077.1 hypothetical protein A8C46_00480 [Ligilactobacillus salivarius]PAY58746.1 hypothetical protein A8C40_01370 [Ligilactobacillus salivarius]